MNKTIWTIVNALLAFGILFFLWMSIPRKEEPIPPECVREIKTWAEYLIAVNKTVYYSMQFANTDMPTAQMNLSVATAMFQLIEIPTCYDPKTVMEVQKEQETILIDLVRAYEYMDQARFTQAANLMISINGRQDNVRVYLDSFDNVTVEGE